MVAAQLINGGEDARLCQQLAVNGEPELLRIIGRIAANEKHGVFAKIEGRRDAYVEEGGQDSEKKADLDRFLSRLGGRSPGKRNARRKRHATLHPTGNGLLPHRCLEHRMGRYRSAIGY